MRTSWVWCLVAVVVAGALVGGVWAQQGPPGGGRGARGGMGGRGGRGFERMSEEQRAEMMARMQERRLGRIKEQLEVTDDEWAVLSEPIAAITALMGEEMQATGKLREVVRADESTTEQVKTALDEYRKSNKDIAGRREKLQTQLKELVTVKQEAVLVLANILE